MPAEPALTLWWDAPHPSNAAEALRAARWCARHVSRVSVLINPGLAPLYRSTWPEQLIGFTRALDDVGLDTRWMLYVGASRVAADALIASWHELRTRAAGRLAATPMPDLDVEQMARGITPALARHLVDGLEVDEFAMNCVPTAKGTLPAEALAFLDDPRLVHAVFQSYTQDQGEGHWSHHAAFRAAGPYLQACLDLGDAISRPGLRVSMGVILGFQQHSSGPKGLNALDASRDLILARGFDVAAWSSKMAYDTNDGAESGIELWLDATRRLIHPGWAP